MSNHKSTLSYHEQLAAIRDVVRQEPVVQKSHRLLTASLPSAEEIGKDSVDHINVWDSAKTELGRNLSHGISRPFSHSVFGKFDSISALWYYVRSNERDDRIRYLHGARLKALRKGLTYNTYVPNFQALIMDANWQKLEAFPFIAKMLKESRLPLDCYYLYKTEKGIRIRPPFAHWLLFGFNEIRDALKEDRQPDFSLLIDRPDLNLYTGKPIKPAKPAKSPVEPRSAAPVQTPTPPSTTVPDTAEILMATSDEDLKDFVNEHVDEVAELLVEAAVEKLEQKEYLSHRPHSTKPCVETPVAEAEVPSETPENDDTAQETTPQIFETIEEESAPAVPEDETVPPSPVTEDFSVTDTVLAEIPESITVEDLVITEAAPIDTSTEVAAVVDPIAEFITGPTVVEPTVVEPTVVEPELSTNNLMVVEEPAAEETVAATVEEPVINEVAASVAEPVTHDETASAAEPAISGAEPAINEVVAVVDEPIVDEEAALIDEPIATVVAVDEGIASAEPGVSNDPLLAEEPVVEEAVEEPAAPEQAPLAEEPVVETPPVVEAPMVDATADALVVDAAIEAAELAKKSDAKPVIEENASSTDPSVLEEAVKQTAAYAYQVAPIVSAIPSETKPSDNTPAEPVHDPVAAFVAGTPIPDDEPDVIFVSTVTNEEHALESHHSASSETEGVVQGAQFDAGVSLEEELEGVPDEPAVVSEMPKPIEELVL